MAQTVPGLGNNRASGAPGLSRDLPRQLPHGLRTRRARPPALPHVPPLSPGTTWHGEQEQRPPHGHCADSGCGSASPAQQLSARAWNQIAGFPHASFCPKPNFFSPCCRALLE